MVTAHALRQITNNYDLFILLDMLKSIAKTGECTYSVDYLDSRQEKQLERLGFKIHYHDEDDEDDGRTISW